MITARAYMTWDDSIDNIPSCPYCGSMDVTRFQWVDNKYFYYFTCWICDGSFTVDKVPFKTSHHLAIIHAWAQERLEYDGYRVVVWKNGDRYFNMARMDYKQ